MANDRSLQTIRGLLTDPKQTEGAIELFSRSTAWGGVLARMADQLRHYKDKELASTLTTTNRFLRFLDTPAIIESTSSSSCDPAALLTGRMTVYLVLPPEHMRAQSGLLRLWVAAMLRAVVKGGLKNKNKVHFVLDEAASLGQPMMGCLEDAIDKYRAFSVLLQFYFQSLGQVRSSFREGKDQTLLSNTTQIYFGVNDLETAEMVSRRLGERTLMIENYSSSRGGSAQYPHLMTAQNMGSSGTSWNESSSTQQLGRSLLKPEEVLNLSERVAIIFAQGVPPIKTWLVRYYENAFRRPGKGGEGFWAGLQALAVSFVLAAFCGLMALWMTAVMQDRAKAEQRPPPFVPPPQQGQPNVNPFLNP
jgi:type IV secretion system protein VirD4